MRLEPRPPPPPPPPPGSPPTSGKMGSILPSLGTYSFCARSKGVDRNVEISFKSFIHSSF